MTYIIYFSLHIIALMPWRICTYNLPHSSTLALLTAAVAEHSPNRCRVLLCCERYMSRLCTAVWRWWVYEIFGISLWLLRWWRINMMAKITEDVLEIDTLIALDLCRLMEVCRAVSSMQPVCSVPLDLHSHAVYTRLQMSNVWVAVFESMLPALLFKVKVTDDVQQHGSTLFKLALV